MGRIDDALMNLEGIEDRTERAFQLAGLISTLFKLRGVVLVVTGQLAFDSYANAASTKPELELAALSGKLAPRVLLEIMRGQLHAKGSIFRWKVAGIPIRFENYTVIAYRDLCRDFMTDNGVVKLFPVEEITAEYILAAVYPEPDPEAHTRARLLLINGLTDAFKMDWTVLHTLCHQPEYRVGEELAQMRLAAKKDVDAIGAMPDPLAQAAASPTEIPVPAPKPKRDTGTDDIISFL